MTSQLPQIRETHGQQRQTTDMSEVVFLLKCACWLLVGILFMLIMPWIILLIYLPDVSKWP